MKQDDRAPFVEALQTAREAAYAPGEYVEQESFMRAGEIRALAERAGIASGVSVLDLCCGVAGPGRFLTRELRLQLSRGRLQRERHRHRPRPRAQGLPCRFEVARVPPLPPGEFDVVLLLETMLAFPDKQTLLDEISRAVTGGGRFAFTLEEGAPLTESERARMPDADTVWLTPLEEMRTLLDRAGLIVRWQEDWSRSHRAMADALTDAFAADATAIAAQIGRRCAGRAAGRPPALERLAGHRARPQDRMRRREAGRVAGLARRPIASPDLSV